MKNTVNMDALKAVSVLSGFNWYKITAENTENGTQVFYATGLIADHGGEVIKAEKQFATPVYMAGFESVTATAENCFVFHLPNGGSYTVEGLEKALTDPDNYNAHFNSMEKLLCDYDTLESLTDYERSHKDENGNLLVVLDLRKLVRLTGIQSQKIKRFINVNCGGEGVKYQTPRTVYFKFTPDNAIIAGVWDYTVEQPMNEKRFYESYFAVLDGATEENKQAKALYKLAQSVTAAI